MNPLWYTPQYAEWGRCQTRGLPLWFTYVFCVCVCLCMGVYTVCVWVTAVPFVAGCAVLPNPRVGHRQVIYMAYLGYGIINGFPSAEFQRSQYTNKAPPVNSLRSLGSWNNRQVWPLTTGWQGSTPLLPSDFLLFTHPISRLNHTQSHQGYNSQSGGQCMLYQCKLTLYVCCVCVCG